MSEQNSVITDIYLVRRIVYQDILICDKLFNERNSI